VVVLGEQKRKNSTFLKFLALEKSGLEILRMRAHDRYPSAFWQDPKKNIGFYHFPEDFEAARNIAGRNEYQNP
jgi:hypothetical protein